MSESRPGVTVIQEFDAAPGVVVSPVLVPAVVGVCHEILEVRNEDGSLNDDARFADEKYLQAALLIPQADFPSPRDNIDEVNVDESSVRAFLKFGGRLTELPRGSHDSFGQAFLKAVNTSTSASFRTTVAGPYAFGSSDVVLTLALDVVNPTDTSSDTTVVLNGTMTAAEVVDAINEATGTDAASVFTSGPSTFVQVTSETFGATSSVTIRAGGAALPTLFGGSFDESKENRVVGAGFRGQDDDDDDLTTPFIEFFRGVYTEDDVDTTFPAFAGLVNQAATYTSAKASAVTYTGGGATVPLSAATATSPGDQFWADGVQVGGAQVIKVESTRFKLGILNNSTSTFDDDGNPTNRVYDTHEVNTPSHGTPLAPKYAYFRADGLVFGDIDPEGTAASITGSTDGLPARPALIQSTTDITFPVSPAGLTLLLTKTVDGVQDDQQTKTILGGPFATIALLVTAVTSAIGDTDYVVSNSGDRLVIRTANSGADQGIILDEAGTANASLEFSTVTATESTGKDVEFAEQATLTGAQVSLPLPGASTSSVDLSITVEDSFGTHTVSTTGVSIAADATLTALMATISTALGGDGVSTIADGALDIADLSSSAVGPSGTLSVTTVEGGASVTVSIVATDGTDGFRYSGFFDNTGDEPAEIVGLSVLVFPIAALAGTTLTISYDDGTGPYILTALLGAPEAAAVSADALVALFNANAALTDVAGVRVVQYVANAAGTGITVRTIVGGPLASLDIDATLGSAGILLGYVEATNDTDLGAVSAGNADDTGDDGLKGNPIGFFLDDIPTLRAVTFASNSLDDAVDDINALIGGSTDVASTDVLGDSIILTSPLVGVASKVEIETTAPYDVVALLLGLTGDDTGTGRPNPDFYLDVDGSANIGAVILRDTASGIPFELASSRADLYLAYTGLRSDVTSSADSPALLTFDTTADMEEAIGPISTENPLALGVFLALANAPTVSVAALGVDEANDAAPFGTLDGWARALEYLEQKEVYGLAPLTDDVFIQGLAATHTQSMSQPANRLERIIFLAPPFPDRAAPTTVLSGEEGESGTSDNVFVLDDSPSAELAALGLPGPTYTVEDNLYLEILVVEGGSTDLRRYSVEEVNGTVLTLRVVFGTGENTDGFYTTETLDETLTDTNWTLFVRGDPLVVTGTTRPDLNAIAAAAAAEGQAYADRRIYLLFGRNQNVSIDGSTQLVEMFYASAAIVGMVAQLAPQQPFTNIPIAGLGQVFGTDDTFSENQMDVIADGGRYLLINQGGRVMARHSRSTDTTSIEKQELSITKAIDWLAKGLRQTNRVFIGRNVITPGFLDQLSISNEGFLSFAKQLGVVSDARLESLLQSETEPDTVLIEVDVEPAFPCNRIRITIVT